MKINKFLIAPIKGYQYLSAMLPDNCRYYPSCSEYAKWQFLFNAPHKALLKSSLRIARCNQFFAGGIDYPLVRYTPPMLLNLIDFNRFSGTINISFWLVPQMKQNGTIPTHYYVLKDFDATAIGTQHTA